MSSRWPTKPLEECICKVPSTAKVQRRDFLESGDIPIVSQEDGLINGYWDRICDAFLVTVPVTVFGDHTRILKYVDFDFVVGADGVKILHPCSSFDPKFFFYQLNSVAIPSRGYSRHFRFLKKARLSIPPLQEQRRIVATLEEAFAAVATATTNAEKNLANAQDLIRAEVQHLFQHPEADWREYRLPEICSNWDAQRRPVTKSDRIAGDVPYYGASGQVDSVRDHLFDDNLLLVSEDGANLVMRTYPIAFSISGKSWVNNHAHVLKFGDGATQQLVEYYLNSISLQNWISGMAQPKLSQKALNEIPIPLPPVSKREDLVARLDSVAGACEMLMEGYQERLRELGTLRQSILHRGISGELTGRKPLAA